MTSTAVYKPSSGIIVSTTDGFSFVVGNDWTIAKIERHLSELADMLD